MIQTLFTAADAAVFELSFQTKVYSPQKYDIFIDDTLYARAADTNVFSVYGLQEDREYTVTVRECTGRADTSTEARAAGTDSAGGTNSAAGSAAVTNGSRTFGIGLHTGSPSEDRTYGADLVQADSQNGGRIFGAGNTAGTTDTGRTSETYGAAAQTGLSENLIARTMFRTLSRKRITVEPSELKDDTERLQAVIDSAAPDEYIYFTSGEYRVTALFLHDFSHIELAAGCTILGCLDRTQFPILRADESRTWNGMNIPLGTWEGRADDSFASIFTGIGIRDFCLYGRGIIDCRADKTDWWIQHRVKRTARRPKGIFLHTCENGVLAGITVKNTPSWNQHPFYCSGLKYLDVDLQNPPKSPTTDGCNPESCDNVLIAGCRISVGDDCIAVKSGKAEFAQSFGVPSKNITIRNCLMTDGHGGVTLGSELSAGLYNISVSRCIFRGTDRGLRIKTQRGRGSKAVLDSISFYDILMDNVKAPFVINAYYKAGNDEFDEYRFSRAPQIVDERTPRLGSFTFKDITARGAHWCAAYFLGLSEQPIESVTLENVSVDFAPDAQTGAAAMTNENEQFCRAGFIFENVSKCALNNVSVTGQNGEPYIFRGISPIFTADSAAAKDNSL